MEEAEKDQRIVVDEKKFWVARALDRLQAREQQLLREQAETSKEGQKKIGIFVQALKKARNAARDLPPHLLNVWADANPHFEQTVEVWMGVCEKILARKDRRTARDDAVMRKFAVAVAYQLMLDCSLSVQRPVRKDSAFCKLSATLLGYPQQDLRRDCAELAKPGIK
jgi:hypothetical protein